MFLTRRFYGAMTVVILVIAAGHFWPPLFVVGKVLLALLAVVLLLDVVLLWSGKRLRVERTCSDRFSNGDNNAVRVRVENNYPFDVWTEIIDEAPVQFQRRDITYHMQLPKGVGKTLVYQLRPARRGVYEFGQVRVFCKTVIGLAQRMIKGEGPKSTAVKVYPSYLMLHQYELLAFSNRLTEMGIKRVRQVGHNTEFEHIQDYVSGDDFRTINWKATARRGHLMVNIYQDERSQHVYSVIDRGRVMQQTTNGMTLLDYSINAALVLSYVALHKDDHAGLITFCEHMDTFVPATHRAGQMQTLLEQLYATENTFGETDFSALCNGVERRLNRRSLLVVYTQIANMTSMKRQLIYLRQLSQRHCVLVVFFNDDEMDDFCQLPAQSTEDYYMKVIAEKSIYEKRLVVSMLQQNGVYALLTSPQELSVNLVNRYLELKSRGVL